MLVLLDGWIDVFEISPFRQKWTEKELYTIRDSHFVYVRSLPILASAHPSPRHNKHWSQAVKAHATRIHTEFGSDSLKFLFVNRDSNGYFDREHANEMFMNDTVSLLCKSPKRKAKNDMLNCLRSVTNCRRSLNWPFFQWLLVYFILLLWQHKKWFLNQRKKSDHGRWVYPRCNVMYWAKRLAFFHQGDQSFWCQITIVPQETTLPGHLHVDLTR